MDLFVFLFFCVAVTHRHHIRKRRFCRKSDSHRLKPLKVPLSVLLAVLGCQSRIEISLNPGKFYRMMWKTIVWTFLYPLIQRKVRAENINPFKATYCPIRYLNPVEQLEAGSRVTIRSPLAKTHIYLLLRLS